MIHIPLFSKSFKIRLFGGNMKRIKLISISRLFFYFLLSGLLLSLFSCKGAITDYKNNRPGYLADSNFPSGWAILYDTPSNPTNLQFTDIKVGGKDVLFYKYNIDNKGWSETISTETRINEGQRGNDGDENYFQGTYKNYPLEEGLHTIEVIGVNSIGVLQEIMTPTRCIWRIDITPPNKNEIILRGCPDNITDQKSAKISVSGIDIISYRYRVETYSDTETKWIESVPWSSEQISAGDNIELNSLNGDPVTLYRLSVVATDRAGNETPHDQAKIAGWYVDFINPVAYLNNKPEKFTNKDNTEITVSIINPGFKITGYKFQLGIPGNSYGQWNSIAEWTDPSIPITLNGLLSGNQEIRVIAQAEDISDNNQLKEQPGDTPTVYQWTIMKTEDMNLSISRYPSENPTTAKYAIIKVNGTNISSCKYRLDEKIWKGPLPTGNDISLSNLDYGEHKIEVTGIDMAGNEMAAENAVSEIWTISEHESNIAVFDASTLPANPTNINSTDIGIMNTSDGTEISGYMYRLDSGQWTREYPVTDILSETDIPEGNHAINTVAKNIYGIWQPFANPTDFQWALDLTCPVAVLDENTLPALPPEVETGNSISIKAGGDQVANYRYRLDSGDWSETRPVSELISITGLDSAVGGQNHILEVMGQDTAGNWQAHEPGPGGNPVADFNESLTKIEWVIDADLPTAALTIISPPENPTSATDISAEVSNTDPDSGTAIDMYSYKLDNGIWSDPLDITVDISKTGLSDGAHTIYAIARDIHGNWQTQGSAVSPPSRYTWVVDTTPPTVNAGTDILCNSLFNRDAITNDDPGTVPDFSGMGTWTWSSVSGPGSITFGSANSEDTEISADKDGVYTIRLTASDRVGNTASDDFNLTWDTTAPSVHTGADLYTNVEITGNATVTDINGISSYSWSATGSGGTVNFGSVNSNSTTINATSDGSYAVRLTATDNAGNTSFDEFQMIWDTTAPSVNAGTDKIENTECIQNAGISDSGSGIASYGWTTVSGPGNITFSNESGTGSNPDTSVTPDADGTYVLRLTATDNLGYSASDDFQLIWDKTNPVINAGPDSITDNSPVNQDATVTDAGDAGIASYAWSDVTSSPAGSVSFNPADTVDTEITATADDTYTLRLTVTDNAGNSASDDISFIRDTTVPVVDAGTDKTSNISIDQNTTVTDAGNGGIATFLWEDITAPSAGTITFGSPDTKDTSIEADSDGIYTIRLTVTDNAGNTASDTMTLIWDTTIPTVDAGSNKTVNSLISQDATAWAGSGITNYTWTKLSGPGDINFSNPTGGDDQVDTQIQADTDGTYLLELSVTDTAANTASDTMTFIWDETPPVITPNPDAIANSIYTIDAAVTDAGDGGINNYSWTGPGNITFGSDSLEDTSVTSGSEGVYSLVYTVTDNAGNSSSDQMTFTWDMTPPSVNAGTDKTVTGSVSQDAEVTDTYGIESFSWTKYSGAGTVTFGTPSLEDTTINANSDDSYTIRLTVTDLAGNTAYDDMTYIRDNANPTVNAGNNIITNTQVTVNASVGDTGNGGIKSYSWSRQNGSDNIVFGTPDSASTTIRATAEGDYNLRLTVTDNAGNTAYDEISFIWDTTAPDVNAGTDVISHVQVTQDATITEANGVATYSWSKTSGTGNVTISNISGTGDDADTSIFPEQDGTFTLTLSATDSAGNTGTDSMQFTRDTVAPVVNPGTVHITNTAVTQDATVTDTGGTGIKTYEWTQTGGTGTITFSPDNTEDTLIISDTEGVFTIRLTVTDNAGNVSHEDVNFTWDKTSPSVDAGSDIQTASACDLSPTASDANDIASYLWEDAGATGHITFTGADTEKAHIEADSDGIYTIRLTATDQAGNSASDTLSFTWDTTAPSVNAGSDITASSQTTINAAVTEDGSGIKSYSWTMENGPASGSVSFGSAGSEDTTVSANIDGVYTLRLTVTDIVDNTGFDEVLFTWDSSGPEVDFAETLDSDNNGHIDHYKITFNENINDSTFPGYVLNSAGNSQTQWIVSGYNNLKMVHGTSAPEADTSNDNIIYLTFDAISAFDTIETPDLTTTSAPGVTDSNDNVMAQIAMADINETDSAAPVIIKATAVKGTNILAVNFSEPVDGDGSSGGCNSNVEANDFNYNDVSLDGASAIDSIADNNACSDNRISLNLNNPVGDSDIEADQASAAGLSVYDMSDNAAKTTNITIGEATSPYVMAVTATGAYKIRITYSEAMDNATASVLGNYKLTIPPSDTAESLTGIIQLNDHEYELTTGFEQNPSTTYMLEITSAVSTVTDSDEGAELVDPKFGTFLGNERLKVTNATCLTVTSLQIMFNKSVLQATAEDENRYKLTGPSDLGSIITAVRGSGSDDNAVTISHTDDSSHEQTGATYTVIGSNGINDDGFNDNIYGPIKNSDNSETLQPSPNDRAQFQGCGDEIDSFTEGPVASDPFGDESDFGYLAYYNNRVYIGPNFVGNSANRFEPDGSNPGNVSFEFEKDSGDHRNSATTYTSIGFFGCTPDVNTVNVACGPDNEDGRGLFYNGTLNGIPYLFIGGAVTQKTDPDFDYIYYTSDTDSTLNFKYIDLGEITGTMTQGLSAMTILSDRLFAGMAKASNNDGANVPDFGKINFSSGSTEGDCTPGNSCNATGGDKGVRIRIDRMPYFGGGTQFSWDDLNNENTGMNQAHIVGVDSLFVFNGLIYAGNGGANVTNHNGSVIRSNNANPGRCSVVNNCPDWTEIGPRSHPQWFNSNHRYSIELTKTYDLIPSDKAIPAFTEFNGNLYMLRNTCNVAQRSDGYRDNVVCTSGCNDSSVTYENRFTNRQPQLWKCDPSIEGDANSCESGDWLLIDSGTDGITNFGHSANHSLTMIIKNGPYLYLGFDNVNGVEIWRTKDGVTDPVSEADFEQIGETGLGDPVHMKEIYSAITTHKGLDYYIYISSGLGGNPVAVFRNRDTANR